MAGTGIQENGETDTERTTAVRAKTTEKRLTTYRTTPKPYPQSPRPTTGTDTRGHPTNKVSASATQKLVSCLT
jgi:hypothetical protein